MRSNVNLQNSDFVTCDWSVLSSQLLNQWNRLTKPELENTNQNRHEIARLIEEKYGVEPSMTENYLANLERTLPLFH